MKTYFTCLNCGNLLNETNVLCLQCYKLNLNSVYKIIKSKSQSDEEYKELKTFIRNEKYTNKHLLNKNKVFISVSHDKHILEL